MPFYEYECSACSHQMEVLQKISDAPLLKCPDCGKSALKRLISAPVFRLKGAGWYETDFKSENEEKRNIAGREEAEAKADDKADSKDAKATKDTKDAPEGKSESKPEAAKSEPKESAQRKPVAKPAKVTGPTSKAKPVAKAKPAVKAKSKAKVKAKPVKKKAAQR
jgi:putative FmdB family regulatory protein